MVRSRRARILLSPSITALRSVPSMAWLPLLVLSLGIGERPKIVLIAIGAALPLFATIITAARAAEPGTTPPLQAALIVSGLRLGLTQSWVLLVAAELLHSSGGLGFLLSDSSSAGRIDRLFVAIDAARGPGQAHRFADRRRRTPAGPSQRLTSLRRVRVLTVELERRASRRCTRGA